ncbi:MAG: hypothetical protein AB1847_08305 [bacterium]
MKQDMTEILRMDDNSKKRYWEERYWEERFVGRKGMGAAIIMDLKMGIWREMV